MTSSGCSHLGCDECVDPGWQCSECTTPHQITADKQCACMATSKLSGLC